MTSADRPASRRRTGPASAGDQTRPPWRSMMRRAIGSASPRPPRFSSNGAGGASYDRCTSGVARDDNDRGAVRVALRAAGRRRPSSRPAARAELPGKTPRMRRAFCMAIARRSARRTARRARPSCTSRSPASCTPAATSRTSWKRSNGSSLTAAVPAVELARFRSARRSAPTSRAHDFSASSIIFRCRSLSG